MAEVRASILRNLDEFKTEQDKLFVLISITLCADSVATYASLYKIFCLNNTCMV